MMERGANDGATDGDHGRVQSAGSPVHSSPYRSRRGSGRFFRTGPALPVSTTAAGALAAMHARTSSLQRELSWVFVLMFIAVLLGAAATVIGVRSLMNEVHSAASRLHTEADIIADLRAALDTNEQAGLLLLSGAPSDRLTYIQRQQELSDLFEKASTVLPAGMAISEDAIEARRAWQENLAAHGLWDPVPAHGGSRLAEAPAFTAACAGIRARLDHMERLSLESLDAALASSSGLEQLVIVLRSTLFCLTAGALLYYRRRMTKYLTRPLEGLHRGVAKLRAGDYRHRVEVVRRDELGELAQAFNSLAAAVHDSYEELTHRATHDPLTGLANRAALAERLATAFGPGSDRRARRPGLLFIDVDDFKDVNDSFGHDSGDALLIQLAARLKGCVRPKDLVARLGGDEFAIVVMDGEDSSATGAIAARIHRALREPFDLGGNHLMISVSMGGTQKRPGTPDPATLLREADFAMYMAKHGGKDRYQLFDARGYDHMAYRTALKADLAAATNAGQLHLEYQPVIDLGTGGILGVEALVRWHHPTLGVLLPAEFIPLAKETGDVEAIDCWVLKTATRQAAAWRRDLPGTTDLWIAVNLSTLQFRNARSLASITRILSDPATEAGKVVLEATETALAGTTEGGTATLNTLKAWGVRIAIDDFGTGFSSLSALAALPADILKISGSFVSGEEDTRPSTAMLEGILGLAHKLSLNVIAKGIEEPDQLRLLRDLGCSMGQGYQLSRPVPARMIEALLASGTRFQPEPDSEFEKVFGS